MRLPWQRSKKDLVNSRQAVLDAAGALKQVQARNPEVHAVSKVLKDIRERNHFAEQLQSILGGR